METLALIELLDRDGLPRQTLRVAAWPVRIGRAIDCDVVLDDAHVAPHHADLVCDEAGVQVIAAPSVNGVRIGRAKHVAGPMPLPGSGLLTLGTTRLRVRLAGEILAPEQPLAAVHAGGRRRALALVALAVVAALWAGFNEWVSTAPGQSGIEMMSLYLAGPAVLGLWCGLWAMGSKLFQRHFAFWPHLETALFWPLIAMIAETLSGQVAFALSVPAVAKAGHVIAILAIAMLFWRHLSIVLPQRRHAFAWVIASLVVVGGGLDIVEREHRQQPLVGGLYLGSISLPGVRLVKPVSTQAFVQSAQPLEKTLSRWAKASGDDADESDGDDDDE